MAAAGWRCAQSCRAGLISPGPGHWRSSSATRSSLRSSFLRLVNRDDPAPRRRSVNCCVPGGARFDRPAGVLLATTVSRTPPSRTGCRSPPVKARGVSCSCMASSATGGVESLDEAAARARACRTWRSILEPVFGSIDHYADSSSAPCRGSKRRPAGRRCSSRTAWADLRCGPGSIATRADHRCIALSPSARRTTALGSDASAMRAIRARCGSTACGVQRSLAKEPRIAPCSASPASTATATTSLSLPRPRTLPGADNRHLAGVAHVHLLFQTRCSARYCAGSSQRASDASGDDA